MRRLAHLFVFACLGLFAGCWFEVGFIDVSHGEKYRHLVGARYEVIGEVDAYGIRRGSQASADYIALIARPGITGPEVAFETPVRRGSTITVIKVLQDDFAFLRSRITFEVALSGTELPVQGQILIGLSRNDAWPGVAQLNPEVYRRL